EDHPGPSVLREMGLPEGEPLLGLHTGVRLTERSVESPTEVPEQIHIYREGIVAFAGGWEPNDGADEAVGPGGEDAILEEIRITVLHEIGHHFGLDEDDLDHLGYA